MTTTYRAAFGDPQAHKPVVNCLTVRPDTSSDEAIARALAEAENGMPPEYCAPSSPSGITLNVWEAGTASQQQQTASRAPLQQVFQQKVDERHPLVSDAELAKHLQVELASAVDMRAMKQSMLYPEILSQPSSRELTLCRSLSRAHSVRANPRVTTPLLPPEPVVSSDRQRLLTILKQYDLVEREVAGDGNCQFRSLSDQLYGTPDYHAAVREAVVTLLQQQKSSYSCYVPQEYGEYCTSMAKSGTWGDHVTLQAAADYYGLRIMVVTSFAESPVIYIDPATKRSPRTLYLSFWAEVHYNSLYPAEEPPPQPVEAHPEPKAPKVLGSRTLGRVVQGVEKATSPLPSLLGYRPNS